MCFQSLEKDFWVPPGYSTHHWLTSCHMGLTSSHIWCMGWSKSGKNVRKDLQSWEGSREFTLQETGWEMRKWEGHRCSGCPDGDSVDLMMTWFISAHSQYTLTTLELAEYSLTFSWKRYIKLGEPVFTAEITWLHQAVEKSYQACQSDAAWRPWQQLCAASTTGTQSSLQRWERRECFVFSHCAGLLSWYSIFRFLKLLLLEWKGIIKDMLFPYTLQRGEQSQKCLQHFHSEQNPFTLNSPHSVCELNTGLLLLRPDALTNERVCDCLTVWMSECEIYSWDHPLRHRQGSVWQRGSRQLGYRWWGTRTKVMVLMRTIED